jgi:hypothetical protein
MCALCFYVCLQKWMAEADAALALDFKRFKSLVSVLDRKWRLRIFKQCFVGSEAVAALIASGTCENEAQALAYGNALMKAGYFDHVTKVASLCVY